MMDARSFDTSHPITSERIIAIPWNDWQNDRETRRIVRALATFNDQTLREMGIPDRSQIEFVVRFCRDC
jgi:uncharacterized protein YjiS (DUF1127 family)